MGISAFAGRTKKMRGIRRSAIIFLLMAIGMMYLMFIPQVSEVYAFEGEPPAGEIAGSSYEEVVPETPVAADIPAEAVEPDPMPVESDPAGPARPADPEPLEAASAGAESVDPPAPEDVLIDPSGTVYDAITRAAIDTASVNLLRKDTLTDTYVAYGNEGDGNAFITGADGKYNFNLAMGSDYRITATAVGYNEYSWDFTQTDGTEHKINFFLIPLLTGDTAGGWVSFNNDVTIDQNIYTAGNDIKILAPGGSDNFDSIKVNDGVIISTRKLKDGAVDHEAGLSGGNSGSISIISPDITIGAGAKLLANAINDGTAYTAGDVKLEALLNAGSSLLDVVYIADHPKTNITIGNNAVIKGKDITITAKSDCRQEYNPPVPPEGTPDPSAGWLDTGAGELKTIIDGLPDKVTGALKGISIVAGVTVSRATSMISIGEASLIEGQSFEALSASYVNAATKPIAIGAGVAVAIGASDAQVLLNGKIVTAGNCNVNSLADNTVKVVGSSTGIKGLSAGVAVSILTSKSNVEAGSTANFEVGGDLNLLAETIDRNYTLASSTLEEDGKVGIAVAVSNEDGETTAYLGGNADVAGNIKVNALMSKDVFTDTTFFGLIPQVKSGVNAIAGVNTDPNAKAATTAQKALMDKIKGPLMDKIKGMIKSKSNKTQTKTDKVSPFNVAAIAIYTDSNPAPSVMLLSNQRNITVCKLTSPPF
ncbi:hypothetical protein MASR2M70_13680 [Bacillota bacterium]